MATTIKLEDDVREQLREYTLAGESASDAVARLMDESEPPTLGINEDEARRIAEDVAERKVAELSR